MIQAKALQTAIASFNRPVVAGIQYSAKSQRLIIEFRSNGNEDVDYEIIFEHTRGFKLLDEGDLLNYWEALWKTKMLPHDALFEIESGGWLDMEDQAGGFSSKFLGFREFLITGEDDCVLVISNDEPLIVKCSAS
ncbi:hypothetical protein LJ737_13340 [Hymenobacter sp. 15J16-1T3B]|uniref:hypothetical protein n=1 Tax=Hymenobacter sp. 15J16-1T3B TaxID=2886941 RepID=UPI001D10608D|nr:hypothetical protein [Hymenobacter sp. 15J16-1T3B]MCC3158226.1 hypothetical protein [Hymenobacter sp. 15J16-1T3B]